MRSEVYLSAGVFISRGFNVFLDAMNLFIGFVRLVKELCEMGVVRLEMMNGFFVLGEFSEEVVFTRGILGPWVSLLETKRTGRPRAAHQSRLTRHGLSPGFEVTKKRRHFSHRSSVMELVSPVIPLPRHHYRPSP